MKEDKIRYGLGGLIIGGLLMWLTTMTIVNSGNANMMGMMGYGSGNKLSIMQDKSIIDAHFIEQMIPHHEDAIIMAKLALKKAQRTEIKQLAESIIDSQGIEITKMKDWYKSWFGKDVPEGDIVMNQHGMKAENSMHMGMMGNDTDMTRLEKAKDFDKAFVEEMIPHHQMAVMMATMLKNGTKRPEMTKLADDIITAQNREIEQMRGWLRDWGI